MSRSFWRPLLLLALSAGLAACSEQPQAAGPVVLAASSLQESLQDVAEAWAKEGHAQPVLSFAASSALARQVLGGAPADVFVSADEHWMDPVDQAGLLRPGTRADLLANAMVLVAPKNETEPLPLTGNDLTQALGQGPLAMADPDAVPAGKYGKAALRQLGLWNAVENRIVRTENVRAALALVEAGEAPLGLIYATDAQASDKVRIVASFPTGSHPPIRYPVAVLATSDSPEAEAFARFLASGKGQAIFIRHGFGAVQNEPTP
ncbi:molybdate ABC transporter substrate-binding protein [Altericroceibacterium xinjiangense]|uniref:molybdate ABC transporter substrate-binding protein n=1 Tax=Altericroceibacterium xinjiangense TaxID=762261 RepID=UPI000F7D6F29|nr:molybdate ABC transporter substrate-binding protein [Altericroceibacterium xinjiangense]